MPMKQPFSGKADRVVTPVTAIPFLRDMNIELKKVRTAGTVAKNLGKNFLFALTGMTIDGQKIGQMDRLKGKKRN